MSEVKNSQLKKARIKRNKKNSEAWDNLECLSKKIEEEWKKEKTAQQLITETRR